MSSVWSWKKIMKKRRNMSANKESIVHVRWLDGYLERFECNEVRESKDFIWMRLTIGQNRRTPLCNVRWTSTIPESHER